MNMRLKSYVDHALGFGFLEGCVKQRLVKVPPVPYDRHQDTQVNYSSSEDKTTAKIALHSRQLAPFVKFAGGTSVSSDQKAVKEYTAGKSTLVYSFKRIIAKRSIQPPRFGKLLPVKKKTHAVDGRWVVELFGNTVCTTEFYGGEACILFMWNHVADGGNTVIMSEVQAAIASGNLHVHTSRSIARSQMTCRVMLKGFKVPDIVGKSGSLVSLDEVQNLIRSLNHLSIETALPVDVQTTQIQNTENFPLNISVETHIHDDHTLERLEEFQQRFEQTEYANTSAMDLVTYLAEQIKHAAANHRMLIGELRDLASEIMQTLRWHGSIVQLFKRDDEFRIHTLESDKIGVTASASETLSWMTLGLAIPAVRSYQYDIFTKAEVWKKPDHYDSRVIYSTGAVTGYYDRVKCELLFNDDGLVKEWRRRIDNLLQRAPSSKKKFWGAWSV